MPSSRSSARRTPATTSGGSTPASGTTGGRSARWKTPRPARDSRTISRARETMNRLRPGWAVLAVLAFGAAAASGLPARSFEYYNLAAANPAHPQKDPGYQTARFKGLRFRVVPAAKVTAPQPIVRLDAPDATFEIATGPPVLRHEPFTPDAW